MLKTKLSALPLLWLAANAAQAAAPERMQIRYRYGCKADTYVNVDAGTRARLQALFQNINSAAAERDAVRHAVQQLLSANARRTKPDLSGQRRQFSRRLGRRPHGLRRSQHQHHHVSQLIWLRKAGCNTTAWASRFTACRALSICTMQRS